MPEEYPDIVRESIERGGQVWTTEEMIRDFETIGFLAPYVVVRKREDGTKGTLMFTHRPRYYFEWSAD